jgi:hypothetical protein
MNIAKLCHSVVAPSTNLIWLLRFAALMGVVFLFAVVTAHCVDRDAWHWLSRLWPHYFVRWDESSGYPGATFPRLQWLLVAGGYVSALVLVAMFFALSIYAAMTRGRIIGVDITLAAVAVLWAIIAAFCVGVRISIPPDTVAFLLIPLGVGSLGAAIQRGFGSRREAFAVALGTSLCFTSFLWICIALLHVVGDAS